MSRQQAENEVERGRLQSLIAKLEAHVAHQSRQIEQVRGSCMCGSTECLSLAARSVPPMPSFTNTSVPISLCDRYILSIPYFATSLAFSNSIHTENALS